MQNILQQALQALGHQNVDYLIFEKNTITPDGLLVPEYKAPIELQGYFQPIPAIQKLSLGLNLNNSYARFFLSSDVLAFGDDRANDRLIFDNVVYAITGETDWLCQNGWKELLLTKIDEANHAG